MYSSINLESKEFSDYSNSDGTKILNKLSRINLFIGPNNSGKSRFSRKLFNNPSIEFSISDIDYQKINSLLSELKSVIEKFYSGNNIKDVNGIDLKILKNINFLNSQSNLKALYDSIQKWSVIDVNGVTSIRVGNSVNMKFIQKNLRDLVSIYLGQLEQLKNIDQQVVNRKSIYVPTLRGLRGIDFVNGNPSGNDNYAFRTNLDYFGNDDNTRSRIYSGLNLYDDVKKLLLGPNKERTKIKKFEEFLGKQFFNNEDVNIIPHINDNVVHVKIGEDEFPIYDLGDGIQSLIILAYPLFFNQGQKMNIFYEEPDLFLHPGFQRIFLETLLLPEFKSFQFYITTHSNHLLDMTLDFDHISVFTFKKSSNKQFLIENVENDDFNILQLLGVRNSSVFKTNCTIWVEGITDRIYIRKYLELYQKEQKSNFLEDIHYSFVEYGGGNITHWSFLEDADPSHPNINIEKLCGKLFLITDQDGAGLLKNGEKSKKLQRQETLKAVLKERYYCLAVKEIENLLAENVIIDVVKDFEGADSNSLDFTKIKYKEYKSKALGEFIETKISGLTRTYKADSGSIKNKVEFSKKAIEKMASFNELSIEAQELTQIIFKFIQTNN